MKPHVNQAFFFSDFLYAKKYFLSRFFFALQTDLSTYTTKVTGLHNRRHPDENILLIQCTFLHLFATLLMKNAFVKNNGDIFFFFLS